MKILFFKNVSQSIKRIPKSLNQNEKNQIQKQESKEGSKEQDMLKMKVEYMMTLR